MAASTQIELSVADRAKLKTIVANRNSPKKHVCAQLPNVNNKPINSATNKAKTGYSVTPITSSDLKALDVRS
jgi:hypothetical protein